MARKHKRSQSHSRHHATATEASLSVPNHEPQMVDQQMLEAQASAQPEAKPRRMRRGWIHAAVAVVLVGICAGLYSWTADFPMVFDDGVYLQNNPLVKDASSFGYLADFREFANKPGKLGLELDLATNFILRPVAYATFHLNYLLDGFEPRWYRVFNIVTHAGTSILIYALLSLLLTRSARIHKLSRQSVIFISATAALLFAAHPLATESVTYIAQRFTSLGTFFFVLTLLLHFTANTVQSRPARWMLRGASLIAVILGMLTKEFTFTAPVIAVLLDRLVIGNPWKSALRKATLLLLCLPLIPIQVMLVSWAQNDGVFTLNHSINLTNLKDLPWNHWHFTITQLTVVLSYLRRLFWPSNMNIDPEWPLYKSLIAWPVLGALAVFAVLIVGSWFLFRKYRHDPRFASIFGFVLWFFITVAISSGLVPLPDLMAEHRSYLPSIGVFVVVACLLDQLRNSRRAAVVARTAVPLAVGCFVIALGYTTVCRNDVWSSKVKLWEDTVSKSPGKYRAWNNLGAAYQTQSRYDDAMRCFKKAKDIEPLYEVPYLNTAISLNILGRHKEALEELNSLIKVSEKTGKNLEVQYQYGLALLGVGKVNQGMKLLEKIAEVAPTHRPARVMVGYVYSQNHMPAKALKYWKRATALAPPSPQLAKLIKQAEDSLKAKSTAAAVTATAAAK